MRMDGRKRLVGALAVALMVMGCAANSDEAVGTPDTDGAGDDERAASGAADDGPVRVGVIGSVSDACIYIAEAEGYFAEEGVDVELVPFATGSDVIPALSRGQLEAGAITFNAALANAINQGVNITVVADKGTQALGRGYVALLVRTDHIESGTVQSLADIAGMRVGMASLTGFAWQRELAQGLEDVGLTIDDVELVQLGYPDMNTALEQGSIDAAMQAEPRVAQAESDGIAVRFAGGDEFVPDHPGALLAYSPFFAREREDAAVAWMKGYLRGCRLYNDAFSGEFPHGGDPEAREQVVRILTETTTTTDPAVYENMRMPGLHPEGIIDLEAFQSDQEWYVEHGFQHELVDLDEIYDPSWAERAVAALEEAQG